MINVEMFIKKWSNSTYGDLNTSNKLIDPKYLPKIMEIFKKLEIIDLEMDGFSIQRLPKKEKAEGSGGISLTEVFHKVIKSKDFSPNLYLAVFVTDYLNAGKPETNLLGWLARALRSFGSFLREPDLAYKISNHLKSDYKEIKALMGVAQDVKSKVDIILKCDSETYLLWSYQASKRGIPHTLDRIRGARGDILKGQHILCPLLTENAKVLHDLENIKARIEIKLEKWNNEIKDKITNNSRKTKLKEMIAKNQSKLAVKDAKIQNLHVLVNEEVTIINGWYLYPKKSIENLAQTIKKISTDKSYGYDYDELQEIISKPEKLARNMTSFKKVN